jgi:hypothetical protein
MYAMLRWDYIASSSYSDMAKTISIVLAIGFIGTFWGYITCLIKNNKFEWHAITVLTSLISVPVLLGLNIFWTVHLIIPYSYTVIFGSEITLTFKGVKRLDPDSYKNRRRYNVDLEDPPKGDTVKSIQVSKDKFNNLPNTFTITVDAQESFMGLALNTIVLNGADRAIKSDSEYIRRAIIKQ